MSKSPALPESAIPARVIRTRRVAFEYAPDELPRHYVKGDLIMSHVVSMLSSVFPPGEDFFVRSVRNYRDQVTDPELRKQVAGFIGQEAMHSREHDRFNERLAQLGYRTLLLDRIVDILLNTVGARILPKKVQLAVTAALEHYTATLAEMLLSVPEAREMLDVDEVRSLFVWHALEESEHKSVAFDVYQQVSGNNFIRVAVMQAVTAGFVGGGALAVAVSLLLDRDTWKPGRLRASLKALRSNPFVDVRLLRKLRDYNRRDFHPDDHDNAALTEHWRTELFSPAGSLTPRLAGAPEMHAN